MFPLIASIRALGNKGLWTGSGAASSDDCCCPPPPPLPPACPGCTTGVRRWKVVISGTTHFDPDTVPSCPLCEERNGIFFFDSYQCDELIAQIYVEKEVGSPPYPPPDPPGSAEFWADECNWFYGHPVIEDYCGNGFGTDPGGGINPADDSWLWGWLLRVSGGFGMTSISLHEYNRGWGTEATIDDPDTSVNEYSSTRYHACAYNSQYTEQFSKQFVGVDEIDCASISEVVLDVYNFGAACDYSGATVTVSAVIPV